VAVTAAVVSWNTRELLLRCLRSLQPQADTGQLEAWVVDNGSSDGSVEAARTFAPWVRVLEPGQNLGYGPAINLVARHTRSEWLLAANADVALEPGALRALLTVGEDSTVGCVAPRLVRPDGTTEHSVYPFPTIPFTLAFGLGIQRLLPGFGARACLEGYWDSDRPRRVPWAIGACLLLRRRAFEQAGGFDERQWMFAEDLDLGWRLHDRGWVTRYEPSARVLHSSGAATRPAFGEQRTARFMAATYAMLTHRRGRTRALLTGALNVAGAAARLMWMAPVAVVVPSRRAQAIDAWRWLRAHVVALRALDTLAPRG
jgi:N-acetylglucosaminyl-diphospho-decaprenol L-rhamnosyltransferase